MVKKQDARDSCRSQVCARIEPSQGRRRRRLGLAMALVAMLSNGTHLLFAVEGGSTSYSTSSQTAAAAKTEDATLNQAGEQPGPKFSWVPNLLYGIIDSPNRNALDALYDAAFAAGPPLVPQLVAAIADDRTAEFAAQSLAFIGGEQAMNALSSLVHDPRNLDLRRFYYGAMGALEGPPDTQVLIDVIRQANTEPDRAVTDAAIIALTVRSDLSLVIPLQKAGAKITDPVIEDDLANAVSIIQSRARYLASHRAQTQPSSIEQAIRIYFIPAIRSVSAAARHGRAGNRGRTNQVAGSAPSASFEIRHVEYGPDHERALARVRFEDPEAIAHYWIVLQKKGSNWAVDTAWLGAEQERPAAPHSS